MAGTFRDTFKPVNVAAEKDELGNVVDSVAESVKALPVAAPATPVEEAPVETPVVEEAPSFRDVFKPVAEPVEDAPSFRDVFKPVAEEPSAALTPVTLSAYQSGLAAAKAGDFIKANEEWAPLAETGNPRTQYHLGVKFQNGIGLPQDNKEAVKWFQLAAEQGLAKAQYNLGIMYFKGRGVIQHYKEAVKWYRLAAEQGLAEAQSNLGFMHEKGQGVPQDNAIAHMWFNIASANGNSKSGEWRDERAGLMTQADISKAQAKARECMSSGYTKCGY
jgi:TPR repeat protein